MLWNLSALPIFPAMTVTVPITIPLSPIDCSHLLQSQFKLLVIFLNAGGSGVCGHYIITSPVAEHDPEEVTGDSGSLPVSNHKPSLSSITDQSANQRKAVKGGIS